MSRAHCRDTCVQIATKLPIHPPSGLCQAQPSGWRREFRGDCCSLAAEGPGASQQVFQEIANRFMARPGLSPQDEHTKRSLRGAWGPGLPFPEASSSPWPRHWPRASAPAPTTRLRSVLHVPGVGLGPTDAGVATWAWHRGGCMGQGLGGQAVGLACSVRHRSGSTWAPWRGGGQSPRSPSGSVCGAPAGSAGAHSQHGAAPVHSRPGCRWPRLPGLWLSTEILLEDSWPRNLGQYPQEARIHGGHTWESRRR